MQRQFKIGTVAHESIETAAENFYALYNNILKRH